jgi:MFS transporter, DHA1 family, tetracycline resistance protein
VNGDAPTKARPAALVFIFITLVLDMLALGMIVPVLPKLVEDFVHGDTARAAYIVGVFGTVWALMQFVFSPVLARFPITTAAVRWCCFRTSGSDSITS